MNQLASGAPPAASPKTSKWLAPGGGRRVRGPAPGGVAARFCVHKVLGAWCGARALQSVPRLWTLVMHGDGISQSRQNDGRRKRNENGDRADLQNNQTQNDGPQYLIAINATTTTSILLICLPVFFFPSSLATGICLISGL